MRVKVLQIEGSAISRPKKRMSVRVFVPRFGPKTGTLCPMFSAETEAISRQKYVFAGGKEWKDSGEARTVSRNMSPTPPNPTELD